MSTKKWNPTINQGSTFNWGLLFTNEDGVTPMNLTGFSLRGMLRRTVDSLPIEMDLTENSRLVVTDALNGLAEINIGFSDTMTLRGQYKFDIELYNGQQVHRLVEGVITVSPEVTRDNPP